MIQRPSPSVLTLLVHLTSLLVFAQVTFAFTLEMSVMDRATGIPPTSTTASSTHGSTTHNRIVFGTAAISQAADPFGLFDVAYEKGFRRFDLARTYGGGASEKIMGDWIRDRQIDRSELNLITKGGMGDDKYGDPDRPILTRSVLKSEILTSLHTLGTDYVDLYMYHRDDPRIPVEKLVDWAHEVVVEPGLSDQWGVSNWSFDRFRQAHEYAISQGLSTPRANSPQLSLARPQCDIWPTTYSISGTGREQQRQIRWYEEHGVELVCWEVLAKGFMANPELWTEDTVDLSFLDGGERCELAPVGTPEWRLQRIQRAYCHPENYRRRRAAMEIAQRHDMSLAQIATLYALSVRDNVSVTVGFLEASQLDDMEGLTDLLLDKECVLSPEQDDFSWDDCIIRRGNELMDSMQPLLNR